LTKDDSHKDDSWLEDYEGQLAIDAYQTNDAVVIKAPIAGVRSADLEISITDEVVTIRGTRHKDEGITDDSYFCQECYWGAFSRSYVLPVAVDSENAKASLKDGVLIINIPKQERSKTRILQINSE